MIKTIIRGVFSNSIALIATPYVVTGFIIDQNLQAVLIAAAVLTAMHYVVKPLIQIISFPINFVTLGFFGWFINSIVLFITAYFIAAININPGDLNMTMIGIPIIELSWIFTLIAAATLISMINWTLKKVLL